MMEMALVPEAANYGLGVLGVMVLSLHNKLGPLLLWLFLSNLAGTSGAESSTLAQFACGSTAALKRD